LSPAVGRGIMKAMHIAPAVADALVQQRPVVALESTLIAHGLPRPLNLETARQAESAIREAGAIPATIAVLDGQPTIGLTDAQLEHLAGTDHVLKASRRDLAIAIAQKKTAATTVAATMFLAHRAGIRVFATGGIGGAHRGHVAPSPLMGEGGGGGAEVLTPSGEAPPPPPPQGGRESGWDISADLVELSRTPVAVVCAGAKGILDIPRTLEILETLSVPVVGYRTGEFPAFYVRGSGEGVSARVETPEEAADLIAAHWGMRGAGLLLAQPVAEEAALEHQEFEAVLQQAEQRAAQAGIRGNALTPFLLARLAELTGGKTLRANQTLIVANARLAGQVAQALSKRQF
jgi:pseudouridylate synthase